MANIQVGEVEVEGGRYQVILRRVGDAVGDGQGEAAPLAQVGAPGQNVFAEDNEMGDMNANANAIPGPNNNPGGGGKKGKKAKKAKGTRKLSPYMKFAQEARPKILKENPEMKSDIIGVGRKIGEMWRALSDDEKAKY